MGPRWALLAALLRAAATREYSLPYTPHSAQCKDPITEFYEERLNKCCSQCPPGEYKAESCSASADTKCSPCSPDTYTAIWNRSPLCFACAPPCRKGFVQNQTCTRSQDRICSCPPNEYCILKIDDYCKVCRLHRKCGKGYRVSRRGTDSTDTECKPCPPGTFSPEESYKTSCKPHRVCNSVAVPGNSIRDTVCNESEAALATVLPHTALDLLLTQRTNKPEIVTRAVMLNSVPDLSYIIALAYYPPATEADLPFSPTEKQCDKKVRNTGLQNSSSSGQEKQNLLETSGSSSSSLNNPPGNTRVSVISSKNNEKKEAEGFQQPHSAAGRCKLHSGDRHNSASSELSGPGGTQVNVTCIIKVCGPDCSSQCPEQTHSAGSMEYGNTPSTGEKFPLSKEENPLKKETEIQISVENEDNSIQE
ncbi:tumor necrosis factor receptor superfamily member 1B-like isoform X2 [Calypte anna]|uniref:tumor necrosis factor receptor superfamily member 1B-like isoform X2 n=1 Tax=Calypte anna TaxID=9244 RepID=UPI0011C40F09|nr:tumor necrosis factor receptor superfamily member 1B-like isoform X2 [Calypte anna]